MPRPTGVSTRTNAFKRVSPPLVEGCGCYTTHSRVHISSSVQGEGDPVGDAHNSGLHCVSSIRARSSVFDEFRSDMLGRYEAGGAAAGYWVTMRTMTTSVWIPRALARPAQGEESQVLGGSCCVLLISGSPTGSDHDRLLSSPDLRHRPRRQPGRSSHLPDRPGRQHSRWRCRHGCHCAVPLTLIVED